VATFTAQPVETIGERSLEPLHTCYKVALRSLNRQMVVVSHDDEGMQPPVRALAGREQAAFEREFRAIGCEDMIAGAGEFEPQFPRHEAQSASAGGLLQRSGVIYP
jgi:hypothetical protein